MFKKRNRYSFRKEVPSKHYGTNLYSLRYGKNTEGLHVAIVISKKIDRRSVVRHRLKRQFMHAIKEVLGKDYPSYSLVFFARKGLVGASYQSIADEISKTFKSLKMTN